MSVTGILGCLNKPALVFWAANVVADYLKGRLDAGETITAEMIEEARKEHTRKKQEAASIGTQVHEWAEQYAKAPIELPTDEKVLNGVIGFLKWVKQHKVRFLASEQIVYSRKYNYVGIMDAEAVVDGKRRLIDFKTSNRLYDEYYLQVAAYRQAVEEEVGAYEENALIVRFDKETGAFETRDCPNHKEDLQGFLNTLGVKQWQKKYASV